mgnify:CR=1 FL=1
MVLAIGLLPAASFSQGTLIFNNRPPSGDAPVVLPNGKGAGSVPGMFAQLYLVSGETFVPLTPATTFQTDSALDQPFVNEINPFVVNGVLPGQSARVLLRVYQGPSYEAAAQGGLYRAESPIVFIPQLGGMLESGETLPPAHLNGLLSPNFSLGTTFLTFERFAIRGDNLDLNIYSYSPWYNFVLESSPDFVTWQPLLTNPPATFAIPYNPSVSPSAFLRLRTTSPKQD